MKYLITFLILALFIPSLVLAAEVDSDGDGLTDEAEINIYYLNPNNSDTDGDSYDDKYELVNGFSPHFADKRLIEIDQDLDSLSDGYELSLKTNLRNKDTDGDGFLDGHEFANRYDPTTSEPVILKKRIEIDTTTQRLKYFLGPVRLNEFVVSTGKTSTPTRPGEYTIQNKYDRPWSRLASLWMPYWMAFDGAYGIHELPEWPGGIKEGADHLGVPVSHGCVRLPEGSAEELYNWAEIGTPVIIK